MQSRFGDEIQAKLDKILNKAVFQDTLKKKGMSDEGIDQYWLDFCDFIMYKFAITGYQDLPQRVQEALWEGLDTDPEKSVENMPEIVSRVSKAMVENPELFDVNKITKVISTNLQTDFNKYLTERYKQNE